jgi:hypothetical protein
MADAGRILIIPRGDYDANSTYDKLDLVKYKGTSWLAKKNATGVEPSEANTEYWFNMIENDAQKLGGRDASEYALAKDFLSVAGGAISNVLAIPLSLANTDNSNCLTGYIGAGETLGYLGFNGVNNPVFMANEGGYFPLFHTGNKPIGTYVGNGDAKEHGVDTKGMGSVAVIWSNLGMGFVTPVGGLFVNGTGGIVYLSSQAYHIASGFITLRTSDPLVNENGITYKYQVL